jgi:hypothetical protein
MRQVKGKALSTNKRRIMQAQTINIREERRFYALEVEPLRYWYAIRHYIVSVSNQFTLLDAPRVYYGQGNTGTSWIDEDWNKYDILPILAIHDLGLYRYFHWRLFARTFPPVPCTKLPAQEEANLLYGMIAPDGKLYLCDYGGHTDLCYRLTDIARLKQRGSNSEDRLINNGWLTVRGAFVTQSAALTKHQRECLMWINSERPSRFIDYVLKRDLVAP